MLQDNSGDRDLASEVVRNLESWSSRTIVSVSDRNIGFSPGVNCAHALAAEAWGVPDLIVLLNPDVAIDSSVLDELVCGVPPDVGIYAPILRCGQRVDRGSMRRRWNWRRLFAEAAGVPTLAQAMMAEPRQIAPVPSAVQDVDITSGACMVVRSEVFGTGLDTRMPMYLEDQEICHRSWGRGLRVAVNTDFSAIHRGGESRRTVVSGQRWLRVAELAEAPARSFTDWTGCRMLFPRTAVAAGGVVRMLLTAALAPAGLFDRGRRSWLREQLLLGTWLVAWGVGGTTGRMPSGMGSGDEVA